MPSEPYEAEDAIKVGERLKTRDFEDWAEVNRNRDDMRYRRKGIDIPGIPEKMEDRRPDVEHQAERFNNYIDGAKLRLKATAKSDSSTDVSSAQKAENALYYYAYDFSSQRSNLAYAADRRATDQTTTKGCGIRHLAFAPDWRRKLVGKRIKTVAKLLEAFELGEGGFTSSPFVLECPDLEATYWNRDLSVFAEIGVRELSAVEALNDKGVGEYLKQYGNLVSETIDEHGKPTENTVKTYHLETAEYIYDVIDVSDGTHAHMLEYRPNPAGRPWYTLTAGNLTSSRNVGEAFQPLLASVYPLVDKLQIFGTLLSSGALQTGRIGYQEVAIGASAVTAIDYLTMPDAERKTVEFSMIDNPRQPRDGYHWVPIPVPDQTVLLQMYQDAKLEVQEKGFPPILDPSAVLKAESGYDRNQQTEAATLYLTPPLTNKAASLRELLLLIADISRQMPVPVTLPVIDRAGGQSLRVLRHDTIKPEEWVEIDLQVSYNSIPLGAQSVQREMESRAVAEGVMSRQTQMANMWDDPIAEDNRINSDMTTAAVKEKVVTDIQALLELQSGAIKEQVLAEEEVPLSDEEIRETLGEGEGRRDQRPVDFSQPGLGAPAVPPVQNQDGGTGMELQATT